MIKPSEHSAQQQQELLRRWLAGKADGNQLQQSATDDPFLADALEGYKAFPQGKHLERTTQLQAKLRKRYQQPQRRALLVYLPRVAAAAILLIAVGLWWTNSGDKKVSDSIAQTEDPSVLQQEDSKNNSTEQIAQATEDTTAPISTPEKKEEALALRQTTPQPATQPSKSETKPEALADATLTEQAKLANREARSSSNRETTPQAYDTPAVSAPRPDFSPTQRPESMTARGGEVQRFITGVVQTANGEPVRGANVSVPNTNERTMTDMQGTFRIAVSPEATGLVINYTGLGSKEITLGNQDSIHVTLAKNKRLEDAIVSNFITKGKSSTLSPTIVTPKGGFDALDNYINKNMRYPELAKAARVEGSVKLVFTVLPDGSVTNIKVEESAGYGLDEEAIRLLKAGPKWQSNGQQITTSYSISFKLQ